MQNAKPKKLMNFSATWMYELQKIMKYIDQSLKVNTNVILHEQKIGSSCFKIFINISKKIVFSSIVILK